MQLIAALMMLGALIFLHELGHFLAARWLKIPVARFSIGFGPQVLGHTVGGVEYALRAIPLGGYVSFPDDEPGKSAEGLHNRPAWQRSTVILAGVVVNAVSAYGALVAVFAFGGVPVVEALPGVVVVQVVAGSGAAAAGLQPGDVITEVNGGAMSDPTELGSFMHATHPQVVELLVERNGHQQAVSVRPEQGKLGVLLQANRTMRYRQAQDSLEILERAGQMFCQMVGSTVDGLRVLLSFKGDPAQLAGPVGVVAMTTQAAEAGWRALLTVGAFISVNLAILNLLPLPALDGGQLVFVLIEVARGRPLPTVVRQRISQITFVLLMGVGAALIAKDTLALLLR